MNVYQKSQNKNSFKLVFFHYFYLKTFIYKWPIVSTFLLQKVRFGELIINIVIISQDNSKQYLYLGLLFKTALLFRTLPCNLVQSWDQAGHCCLMLRWAMWPICLLCFFKQRWCARKHCKKGNKIEYEFSHRKPRK